MKLNYGKTFLLGFGFFGVSVIWGVYNAFVPVFLAEKFNLDVRWIGFFMTLDNIAALLIQPPVGAWSDRLRTPLGRRLPFILVGAPVAAIAFGFIPLAGVLPLFVACSSTLLISMAFWRTPVVALMPDITPSPYRSQANGVINFMGGVGSIISFLGGSALYKMNPAFPFWLGSLLVVVAALLVLFFVREPKVYDEHEQTPGLYSSLVTVLQEEDKSALRVLLAIFFWFLGYNAVEAFFNLYVIHHLGLGAADGARLLGQLSLLFVLFALPAGYIGGRIGRRVTILSGLVLMTGVLVVMYALQPTVLTTPLTKLHLVGVVPVIGLLLMAGGVAWALININSLPMVVDMTSAAQIGTYTGLYYLFSTLAAIAGPNVNGWLIKAAGDNYNITLLASPIFMFVAILFILRARRGEAVVNAPTGMTGISL